MTATMTLTPATTATPATPAQLCLSSLFFMSSLLRLSPLSLACTSTSVPSRNFSPLPPCFRQGNGLRLRRRLIYNIKQATYGSYKYIILPVCHQADSSLPSPR
jgi:hypothetical protein